MMIQDNGIFSKVSVSENKLFSVHKRAHSVLFDIPVVKHVGICVTKVLKEVD